MGRVMLRNLRIAGGGGNGDICVDLSGEEMSIACLFDGVTILVARTCGEGSFEMGHFNNCLFLLDPEGPGKYAFKNCIFEENCRWKDGEWMMYNASLNGTR